MKSIKEDIMNKVRPDGSVLGRRNNEEYEISLIVPLEFVDRYWESLRSQKEGIKEASYEINKG
jgi:hypothetical protein